MYVIQIAINTAATAMQQIRIKELYRRFDHPSEIAAAAAITGLINGATSMAPITTAAESDNKPQLAITVETSNSTVILIRKGRWFSLPKTKRFSSASRRSSGDNRLPKNLPNLWLVASLNSLCSLLTFWYRGKDHTHHWLSLFKLHSPKTKKGLPR